jgi:hypothetical protein
MRTPGRRIDVLKFYLWEFLMCIKTFCGLVWIAVSMAQLNVDSIRSIAWSRLRQGRYLQS